MTGARTEPDPGALRDAEQRAVIRRAGLKDAIAEALRGQIVLGSPGERYRLAGLITPIVERHLTAAEAKGAADERARVLRSLEDEATVEVVAEAINPTPWSMPTGHYAVGTTAAERQATGQATRERKRDVARDSARGVLVALRVTSEPHEASAAPGYPCSICSACPPGMPCRPDCHICHPKPDEALVERLAEAIRNRPYRSDGTGMGEEHDSRYAARAVLPIIDDLIAEKQAEVLREVEARMRVEAMSSPFLGFTTAAGIIADHRARLDTRTDRTEERDEHEAARRAEEVRP